MNNLNQRTGNLGTRRSSRLSQDDHSFGEERSENRSSDSPSQIGEFYSMFEDTIKDISSSVSTVKDAATSLLKQYPFYAILGALAVGFAAGTALRSKRITH